MFFKGIKKNLGSFAIGLTKLMQNLMQTQYLILPSITDKMEH
jgi:hypothetical protein